MTTSLLPVAVYDAHAQTLHCPHCHSTIPVHEWTLIETGYEGYWSIDHDDNKGITARQGVVSEDGDDQYFLTHYMNRPPDSSLPLCLKRARIPDGFTWTWD